jgi:glycerol-3-phosphate dehydrogenase
VIRDLPRLAEQEFDLLVVGGGIYGLTIAYDAAQRGLSVALVERGDFGAATSFNHLKTIHGGLRYLQSADLRRMRQSIGERRTFARVAPRFVSPVPFAMPTGTSLTRNPMAMKVALALDAFVARDRNNGLDEAHRLPAGRVIAGQECRELFDGAIRTVASAALWYDYKTVHGERLTLSFAKAAAKHGAALANYTEATEPLRPVGAGNRFPGVRATDKLTGQAFDIRARVLVNAAGPWAATPRAAFGVGTGWSLLKAMNLVTSRPARKAALVAPTRTGRALVLLPWQGRTLAGTSESSDERRPDDQDVTRSEVGGFLAEVNEAFPALGLKPNEITLVHRGIVPAATKDGRVSLLGHSRLIDHAATGSPEVLSVVGVKYTTARAVAERAVDLILGKLGRAPVVCRTADTLLPDAALDDRDPPDPVVYAIREEMAHTLADVIVRRTGLGVLGYPGDAVAADAANRMQAELGWPEERKLAELQSLKKFYEIL